MNKLKELLSQKKPVVALEAHNGISALVVENSGFDAIWESSLTDSAAKGLPDIELVSMDSRLNTVREIRQVSTKPIIFDGDTGGQIDHFPYWIKRLEEAGVSAVIIEDKAFPKRNYIDAVATHQLKNPDCFAKKIRAGKAACKEMLIIARLESLIAKHSIYEALIRAEAFLAAGADGIMIHSKCEVNADEIFEFAKRYKEKFDRPLVCVPTTYNHIYDQELAKAGFDIIIHANHLLRASYKAMSEAANQIIVDGRSKDLNISSVKEIFKITGYDQY